jgi:hypothetical protein
MIVNNRFRNVNGVQKVIRCDNSHGGGIEGLRALSDFPAKGRVRSE